MERFQHIQKVPPNLPGRQASRLTRRVVLAHHIAETAVRSELRHKVDESFSLLVDNLMKFEHVRVLQALQDLRLLYNLILDFSHGSTISFSAECSQIYLLDGKHLEGHGVLMQSGSTGETFSQLLNVLVLFQAT